VFIGEASGASRGASPEAVPRGMPVRSRVKGVTQQALRQGQEEETLRKR
jgi:hypothetical protein